MTTANTTTAEHIERLRTLLHRLLRTEDTDVEVELISQISIETEAIRRERAQGTGVTISFSPRAAAESAPMMVRERSRRS